MLGFIAILLVVFVALFLIKNNAGFIAFFLLLLPTMNSFNQLPFLHMVFALFCFVIGLGYHSSVAENRTWGEALVDTLVGAFIMLFVSAPAISISGWYILYALVCHSASAVPSTTDDN